MATIGVRSKFIIRDAAVHCFESESKQLDAAQTAPSPIGGNNEDTKYNHQYTGKHDHGLLPELKSGGPHGQLIQALLEAKADSDAFLTELIKQEQSKSSEGGAGKQSQSTPDSKTRKKDKLQSGSTGTPEENAPQQLPGPPESQLTKKPRP